MWIMSCIRLSNTNKETSLLFNELFKITKDEKEADKLLAYFRTPEFIKIFGDYITYHNTKEKSFEDTKFFQDKLDENNEPKLFFNKKLNKYYFLDKSNEPIFYPYKDQGIRSVFDTNDIKRFAKIAASNFYISNIDFNYETLEFTKKSSKHLRDFLKEFITTKSNQLQTNENPDIFVKGIALEQSAQYLNEWVNEVKDYFSSLKINYKEDDISEDEDGAREGEELVPDELMRQESFLKGTKNNVNNNIKLFLSLITSEETNYFNEYEFIPFDDIYNTLNKALSNQIALETEDIFDIYLDIIKELSNVKPYFNKLHNLLSSGKISNDNNFKNQFSSAFTLYKNNYLGSETVTNKDGSRNTIIRNLSDVGSRKGALMSQWEFNFLNKKLTTVGINNLNIETNNKLDNFRNDLKNIKSELDLIPHLNNIKEILNKLGVEFTEKGFNYYINNLNYNEVSLNEKINKLNKTFTDISFGLINYKDIKEDFFSNQNIFRQMSEAEAFYMSEGSDASVFTTGKTKWVYSLPSYIDLRIERWKKDPNSLYKFFLSTEYNKGSDWMYYLTASEILDENERLAESKKRLSEIESNIFNSVQLEGDSVNAVDNKELSYTDSFNDYIHKVLNSRKGGKTYHKTALAADKATERQIHFGNDRQGIFNKYANTRNENGKTVIDSNITKVFYNYFKSDYNRIRYEYEMIQLGENLLPNYHLGSKNALQSQLFPSLSIKIKNGIISLPNLNIKDKENNDIILYDIDGKPVYDNLDIIEDEISQLINNFLIKGIKNTYNSLYENSIFELNENGERVNKTLDESIYNWYVNKSNKEKAPLQIAGDLFINSVISQVEYSKMFTGDVAYYKNITDYKKRVPASYTDGLYMRLNPKANERFFNVSIIKSVEISAQDLDKMREYLPKDIIQKYANNKINSTDAQAWITPERWKFILEKLGKWDSKRQSVYNKMFEITPTFTNEELKLVAQPLKGVYFGINEKGEPTFLKYSQAVLVPNLIKGTGLEKLFNKMTKDANGDTMPYNDQIHELITQDGIKVGSPIPVTTHNENGDVIDNFSLNKIKLDNSNWKLQQDLPTKGIKSTDIGSQIQKNIFQGLAFNLNEDFELDNSIIKGTDLIDYINNIVGALSDKGKNNIINRFGINPNTFKINNEESLYNSLIDQLKTRKDVPSNFIKALEAGLSPYGIPGAFQMFQNVFSSIINKELVKIQTNGGGFIQMADYGLSKEDAIGKNMIFTPWFDENKLGSYRKVNGKKSLSPAGIFLSGSFIAKYIPNYKQLSSKELFGELNEETGKYEGGKIDQEILQNIIGYRIPNQGLPSNDALQVMGILPEEMGDTVIAYTGITTKTGSDFDIDKMYLMIPSYDVIFHKKDKLFAEQYIKDSQLSFNVIKSILSKSGENIDILDREQIYDLFINNILLGDNDLNNEYYNDFNNEYLDKKLIADKLQYVHLSKDENGEINPLYQQSKKALQNRLIKAYKAVLTNEKVLPDVMNPIDLDFIEKDIKNLFPDKPIEDLMSFDAISDLELKNDFRLGKAGLGQNINQLVDSVRGSMGNLYFNHFLGWGNDNGSGTKFDEEWSEELNSKELKEYIESFNEGLNNDEYITLEKAQKFNKIKLNVSMMMLVNGFVDIAKDSYIVKGNWVTQTNDLGFMLIRAGVHPFKVNAFLSQPILKNYVKFKTNQESKSINDTSRINEKFKLRKASENISDEKIVINNITINKRKLFNKLININQIKQIGNFPLGKSEESLIAYNTSKDNLFRDISRKFLTTFKLKSSDLKNNPKLVEELKNLKEEFVNVYESIFEVIPRNFSDISLKELRNEIKNTDSNIDIQLSVIKKFEEWIKDAKKLSANVSASKIDVEGKGKNINSLIIAINKIRNIRNNESKKNSLQGFTSKLHRKNIDTHQNIVIKNGLNFPYSIMKANPKYFFSANNTTISTFNVISDGLYGQKLQNSELADKLEKTYYSYILSSFPALQTTSEEKLDLIKNLPSELKEIKSELKNNTIINELYIKSSSLDGYSFISLPSVRKSVSYQNELTDSWKDLFDSHPKFAEKLVKYSYLISGFNNNINQFHKYIPYEWFNKNRFNSYLKEITFDYNNFIDNNFIDQFHRNNYDDNTTTIRTFISQINPISKGDNYQTGYLSDIKKGDKLPYLTKIIFEKEMEEPYTYYYKLVGTKKDKAYYLRTSLLGYKDNKGNKIVEYSLGHNNGKNFLSIFPKNRINPSSINSEVYLSILKDNTIINEYNSNMVVTNNENSTITKQVINEPIENLDNSENNSTFVENDSLNIKEEDIKVIQKKEIFKYKHPITDIDIELEAYPIEIKNQPNVKFVATNFDLGFNTEKNSEGINKYTVKRQGWTILDLNSRKVLPSYITRLKDIPAELSKTLNTNSKLGNGKHILKNIGFDFTNPC